MNTIRKPMTKQQLAVAVFLHTYLSINDNMPTFVQISEAFGVWSNTTWCHIQALRKRGVLETSENTSQLRFARTEIGLKYRAQIVAERQRQGGAA